MKILWLASWYPNPESPFDGDFIQRHAKAVSLYVPVTVFFVSQAGPSGKVNENIVRLTKGDNLTEQLLFFSFIKTGISFLDKLIYNWRYYTVYKGLIEKYIAEEGVPDLVHVHIPMKAGVVAKWMKKKWRIPFVVTEHSAHYTEHSADSYFKRSFYHKKVTATVFKEAELVTTVSKTVADVMQRIFTLDKIEVIHNVADNALFFRNRNDRSNNHFFRFIHVSTLKENQKNISGILQAVKNLSQKRKDFELAIVGPATDSLRQQVIDLNLGAIVRFSGEISYAEVADQMREANALVLFSRYENFPCVIVEALCCGLPVITTDVGGVKEAVDDNNGIVINADNEIELAYAMDKMIAGYSSFNRDSIATLAKEKYSYETIGKQFYNCYRQIVFSKQ